MAVPSRPAPPRLGAPDLPPVLDRVVGWRARSDVLGAEITGLDGDIEAVHSRLAEARVAPTSVGRLDLTGGSLVDVVVEELRAVEVIARDGSWRSMEIAGGRMATIEGLRARWDGVVLRGIRVDYLSLASSELTDVLFADCRFGTIDLPEARVTRVAFEGCHADEVDTRGLRGTDLDLRGLDAQRFTDPRALAGAWLDVRQAEQHAAAFAQALGIRMLP